MTAAWLAIAGLGAYHGLDPSMGWLFAVALGLQDGSRKRVVWALVPIAVGHLLSVAAVVAIIGGLRALLALPWLRLGGASVLIAFGAFRLVWPRVHPRWVAMRVNFAELSCWSFLMASAHGAGLMLFPILLGMQPAGTHHMDAMEAMLPVPGVAVKQVAAWSGRSGSYVAQHEQECRRGRSVAGPASSTSGNNPLLLASAVVALHTGAMLLATGVIALLVYGWVGLAILRSAWINLDTIWAGALIAAGLISLVI